MTESAWKRLEPLLTVRESLDDALFQGLCKEDGPLNPLHSEEEDICRGVLENEILPEIRRTSPQAADDILTLLNLYMLKAAKRQAFRAGMYAAIKEFKPGADGVSPYSRVGIDS